ncbi:intraflagellar transport protein 70A-like [Convolutriloba macropyga]|uniref:intraflagellar transport protein 70A-like n=1 Tax=Convolutriloba macropyga TaxID=536237 RepID=UPI003F51BCAB
MYHHSQRPKDGEYTKVVYDLIKDQKYAEVVKILTAELNMNARSRAALSILGYCTYQMQHYEEAVVYYRRLVDLCPNNEHYLMYLAQAQYKSCNYQEAMNTAVQLDDGNSELAVEVKKLQAAIKYGEGDIQAAKGLVEQSASGDADKHVNYGCILFKEGKYDESLKHFLDAHNIQGFRPDLCYNIALCYYKKTDYAQSLRFLSEIIERGIKDHPELSVGMATEGLEIRSVGNTLALQETALVEGFNLKAAIEFRLKNNEGAIEALTDMPPRSEEELDPVTLHNQALINFEAEPTAGFEKLQFLIQQADFPPETLANLLIMYVKYDYLDLAADLLAENNDILTQKDNPYLTAWMLDFFEAVLMAETSPEDAYAKFDDMNARITDDLRKVTKLVQDYRNNREDEKVQKTIKEYDEKLDMYLPVLMQQAKIFWDRKNYPQVEKIFRKSVEFLNDNDTWKVNVAHVLFMQEGKYSDAKGFYESLVKTVQARREPLLSCSAIIPANLCVCYIMTSLNEHAEEMMQKIEREEEQAAYEEPDKKIYHFCIINLVIGTLYCAKGNYEFGISRMMKALEPFSKKLGTDTWFYTKRCFLSLLENLAKHMLVLKDEVFVECIKFLDAAEANGRNLKAYHEGPLLSAEDKNDPMKDGRNTITFEARYLKWLFYELRDGFNYNICAL